MSNGNYAQCPQCGAIALGDAQIEEIFGFRYDGTKPQSWCRECRSNGGPVNDERLSASDAADIWMSNGCDEDYTFGYSEEELSEYL